MSNAKWKMILFVLLSLRQGEVFCRVRHRLSLIEPTPLQREADAAGECVSSSLRNAKAAVKRRPPTCSHRFNYGFGTARRFSLSPTNAVNGEWYSLTLYGFCLCTKSRSRPAGCRILSAVNLI